jgi:transposase
VYQLTGVVIERIAEEGERVVVEAVAAAGTGACPGCGRASTRVHSRYSRVLTDLPACGRPVRVRLAVRRFRCANRDCARRTFVEQVPGVTRRNGRLLLRLEAVLVAFSVALGGEAGARLAGRIGLTVGGDTLLRLLRRDEGAPPATPKVLGVDDWAWRRGERYGSILVDLEAGRPVDLLPERTAAALEQWLKEHPGVEIIARDRSTEYARGATAGAPAATQVVDRWHVLRNVREVAERVLDRHAEALRGLTVEGPGSGLPPRRRSAAEEARRGAVRERIAAHYAEIQRLTAAGETISGIARRLGITRIMVRRYRFAAAPPQRDYARRASQLDPYEPYLRRRWAAGCRNGLQLWREIRAQGYPGTSRQVSRWTQERRTEPAPATPHRHRRGGDSAAPAQPAPRRPAVPQLAWLLVRDPGGLDDTELQLLARLQDACPQAATAYPLLQEVARLVREQDPLRLDAWLEVATGCGVPDVATFAAGLQRERPELLAALTLPWSTGPVEGHITRLKLVKRQGYGRCGLDTLKRRFLRAA